MRKLCVGNNEIYPWLSRIWANPMFVDCQQQTGNARIDNIFPTTVRPNFSMPAFQCCHAHSLSVKCHTFELRPEKSLQDHMKDGLASFIHRFGVCFRKNAARMAFVCPTNTKKIYCTPPGLALGTVNIDVQFGSSEKIGKRICCCE